MKKTWTVIDLLQETRRYLHTKGVSSPRLDAELLLAHALNASRVSLYMDFDRPVNPEELNRFRDSVKRRAHREPVAYITGYREFWSLNLKVSPDVLIPRPETELLVEQSVGLLGAPSNPCRMLDIGTGSGAVALALAREIPGSDIFAVDISGPALRVAKDNIEAMGCAGRVHPVCGDCLGPFQQSEQFHLIVSNPPYIRSGDIETLDPEIAA